MSGATFWNSSPEASEPYGMLGIELVLTVCKESIQTLVQLFSKNQHFLLSKVVWRFMQNITQVKQGSFHDTEGDDSKVQMLSLSCLYFDNDIKSYSLLSYLLFDGYWGRSIISSSNQRLLLALSLLLIMHGTIPGQVSNQDQLNSSALTSFYHSSKPNTSIYFKDSSLGIMCSKRKVTSNLKVCYNKKVIGASILCFV